MSDRERWIVYPLLFMTLGIALRDKVTPPGTFGSGSLHLVASDMISQRIHCGELLVDRAIVCKQVEVGGDRSAPPVVVIGADNNTHAGFVQTATPQGVPQIRLFSADTGGIVSTIGRAGKAALLLGDVGRNFGLTLEMPELRLQQALLSATLPKPAPPEQVQAPAASANDQPAEKPDKTEQTEETSEKQP